MILFFTNNLKVENGGLDIENFEEMEQLQKYKNYIYFPYDKLQDIVIIVKFFKDKKIIIYIDFCNSNIRNLDYLSHLNNLGISYNFKIFLKYKGYVLNNEVISILKNIKSRITFLTTINNKQIAVLPQFDFIKYWRIKLIKNPCFQKNLYFDENIKKLFDVHEKYTNGFFYFFVGRKTEHKGVDELIRTFEYIEETNNFKIFLVLIGQEKEKLKYNSENIINIRSIDNQSTLFLIKHICDCMVLNSTFEGLGRILIESLKYHKIILTTKNSMLGEIMIKNNLNKPCLIDNECPNDLLNKMIYAYYCNHTLKRSLRNILYSNIKKEFQKKDLVKILLN